jgi:acyl carrier protein
MEFEKICEVIAEQMGIPKDSITLDTTFREDLNADSLDVYQIIEDLEDSFGLEFESEVAENIRTVGDAVEYVKSVLNS